jgi:S1-C subfamily serine protease
MNQIMLTGIVVLGLINATAPADAAHRQASRYVQAPAQQQWVGHGAYVEEVIANTGAARAGIRPGDVIVGVNGSAISGYPDIDSHVAASGGRALTLDINRDGRRLRVKASPAPATTQNWYGNIDRRRVLGVAHTEVRWGLMSCALDPDCE